MNLPTWWSDVTSTEDYAVSVRGLTVDYGERRGVFDVNLQVLPGGICVLIGPSGCGKTTLLHGIAGFLQPASGSVRLAGSGTARIGLVQQRDALFPWLSVAGNVELGLGEVSGRSRLNGRSRRRKAVHAMLEELGIGDTADRFPGNISGGQRQRAAIARAMIGRPDILLLDEPSASLDAFAKESLQDMLLNLHKHYPVTTVLVTHDIEEALFLGDQVAVMDSGSIRLVRDNPLPRNLGARDQAVFYEGVRRLRADFEGATTS